MPIQVQQAAIVTESERITGHGIGLELAISHEHNNSYATLQAYRAGGITVLTIQASFTGIAQ